MTALAGQAELFFWQGGTASAVTNFALNQNTDQLEFVMQCPEDMTITRIGIRQGTITGASPVYIASIQGVDNTGIPDGTIKGGGTPASATFTPTSGNNNTFIWVTLANSYAAVRGELISAVIAYSSGTIDGSNFVSFAVTSAVNGTPGRPYGIQNDNGTRTRVSTTALFGVGTASTVYGYPCNVATGTSHSSASSPDEYALRLNIPTTICSTYKIRGAVWYGTTAATGAYDVKLYDTDGTTVLQQVSVDTDQDQSSAGSRRREIYFDETTLSTLNAGSNYRLSILPTTGSLTMNRLSVLNSDEFDAFPYGTWATSSTRTDAGAWTDSSLARNAINPIIADITLPASGGGLAAIPVGGFIV